MFVPKVLIDKTWLDAWWYQAITWTNVDLLSVVFCGIHLRAIFWEVLKISICKMSLKITILKLLLYLPKTNEFMH